MTSAALVSTSLDSLLLHTPARVERWQAPPVAEGAAPTARSLRDQTAAAADWTASVKSIKKRLNFVVVDVDESLLRWVHCPSLARPVVAATTRAQLSEWEGFATGSGLIEPLADPPAPPSKKRKGGPAIDDAEDDEPETTGAKKSLGVPVIAMPDALVRLWLDALDKRGVRVDAVVSQWHAMASAWTRDASEPTAVMLVEPGERLTWVWAKGQDLLAGGVVRLERPYPAGDDDHPAPEDASAVALRRTVKRLALEWLTWGAQTASLPDRIIIVGPDATALSRVVENEWAGTRVTPNPCEDAKQATLARLAEAPRPTTDSSRRALVTLSNRPTRSTRRAYWLAGVAMLLVGVAVAGLSRQMARQASEWATLRSQTESEAMDEIKSAQPSITGRTLQTAGNELRVILEDEANKERVELPGEPYDLFAEYERVLKVLSEFDPEKVTLVTIDIKDGKQSVLSLQIDDELTTGVTITQKLAQAPGKISWESRRNNNARNFRLDGNWPLSVR